MNANRTIGIVRWPGRIPPRQSDEMMHVVDWFPTLLGLIGHPDRRASHLGQAIDSGRHSQGGRTREQTA